MPTWRAARSPSPTRSRRPCNSGPANSSSTTSSSTCRDDIWRRLLLRLRQAEIADRCRVVAILLIVLGRGAGGEIAVASRLVGAQGADALHVAQNQRLGAHQRGLIDAERFEELR